MSLYTVKQGSEILTLCINCSNVTPLCISQKMSIAEVWLLTVEWWTWRLLLFFLLLTLILVPPWASSSPSSPSSPLLIPTLLFSLSLPPLSSWADHGIKLSYPLPFSHLSSLPMFVLLTHSLTQSLSHMPLLKTSRMHVSPSIHITVYTFFLSLRSYPSQLLQAGSHFSEYLLLPIFYLWLLKLCCQTLDTTTDFIISARLCF